MLHCRCGEDLMLQYRCSQFLQDFSVPGTKYKNQSACGRCFHWTGWLPVPRDLDTESDESSFFRTRVINVIVLMTFTDVAEQSLQLQSTCEKCCV